MFENEIGLLNLYSTKLGKLEETKQSVNIGITFYRYSYIGLKKLIYNIWGNKLRRQAIKKYPR